MESGDSYHQLFEASPCAILTVDRACHIVDCNRAACACLARGRSELLGTSLLRWLLPDDQPRCKSYILRAFRGGTVEWRARARHGRADASTILHFRIVAPEPADGSDRLNVFVQQGAEAGAARADQGTTPSQLTAVPGDIEFALVSTKRIPDLSAVLSAYARGDAAGLGQDLPVLFAQGTAADDRLKVLLRESEDGRSWEGTIWIVRDDGTPGPARAFAVAQGDPRLEATLGALIEELIRESQASIPASPAMPRAARLRCGGSILVVDDDDTLRGTIKKFLERVGYSVTEAESGRGALARIASGETPDLVVTDLKMNDGTGYWFLDALAEGFPQILRRTVIVTGDPSNSAIDRVTRQTGCPVLRKPFDFYELLDRLDAVASRS